MRLELLRELAASSTQPRLDRLPQGKRVVVGPHLTPRPTVSSSPVFLGAQDITAVDAVEELCGAHQADLVTFSYSLSMIPEQASRPFSGAGGVCCCGKLSLE